LETFVPATTVGRRNFRNSCKTYHLFYRRPILFRSPVYAPRRLAGSQRGNAAALFIPSFRQSFASSRDYRREISRTLFLSFRRLWSPVEFAPRCREDAVRPLIFTQLQSSVMMSKIRRKMIWIENINAKNIHKAIFRCISFSNLFIFYEKKMANWYAYEYCRCESEKCMLFVFFDKYLFK